MVYYKNLSRFYKKVIDTKPQYIVLYRCNQELQRSEIMKIKKTKQEIIIMLIEKFKTLNINYKYYISHEGFGLSRIVTYNEIMLLANLIGDIYEILPSDALSLLEFNLDKFLGD